MGKENYWAQITCMFIIENEKSWSSKISKYNYLDDDYPKI